LKFDKNEHGGVGALICDIYGLDGTPFDGCPRNNLKRMREEMKASGFSAFNVGFEPEFFLFKEDESGTVSHKPIVHSDLGGYFANSPSDQADAVKRDIIMALEDCGIEVEK
jgi:glutamine synthetase